MDDDDYQLAPSCKSNNLQQFKNGLKENKLTIINFCDMTGISRSAVATWSAGKRKAPTWAHKFLGMYKELCKLKTTLGVVLDHDKVS